MKSTRFIKSITKTATETDVVMPWARGARRAAFIAKRSAQDSEQRKAA